LSQLDDPMKRPRDCKFNTDNGILLLDHFDEKAIMLLRSMRDGGFEGPAIMIEEWGFLPEDVFSIYGYYISRPLAKGSIDPEHEGFREGQARFFNQIEIPDYWEIKADGLSGKILDKNKLRGRIFYAPVGRRLVSDVDWLDEKGFARITDHYDSYGLLYSRDYFNKSGEKFARIWFDRGQERIYENYVTGNIVLTLDGRIISLIIRPNLQFTFLRKLEQTERGYSIILFQHLSSYQKGFPAHLPGIYFSGRRLLETIYPAIWRISLADRQRQTIFLFRTVKAITGLLILAFQRKKYQSWDSPTDLRESLVISTRLSFVLIPTISKALIFLQKKILQ